MRPARRVLAAALTALAALSAAACSGPRPAPPAASPAAPAARATGSASPSPSPSGPAPGSPAPIRSIAALGDSLSLGFDACSHFGDCPAVSWITGTDTEVDSIASRLAAEQGGKRPAVYNDARSGEPAADLDRQVSLAIEQQPDLVTVLIGANDICRYTLGEMTSAGDYERAVRRGLRRLADGVPDARILVGSVPDVLNLLPVAADDPTARFLWGASGGCHVVLTRPRATDQVAVDRREAVRQRIDAYDAALAAACASLRRCVYDDGALHAYQPTMAQLTPLDYFHPSVAGLRELAATEWRVLQSARAG